MLLSLTQILEGMDCKVYPYSDDLVSTLRWGEQVGEGQWGFGLGSKNLTETCSLRCGLNMVRSQGINGIMWFYDKY